MTKRKFFKTVFKVTVLSEDEPSGHISLEALAQEIQDGDWSGETEMLTPKKLNGRQAARVLQAQGSDPEFFQIDEKGNDLDAEEEWEDAKRKL